LQTELWLKVNGILQSDAEGFRDELGYLVVATQDGLCGVQRVAVLRQNKWVRFSFDFADKTQCHSFLNGQVPSGVVIHATE
jgi:hypothetical protein